MRPEPARRRWYGRRASGSPIQDAVLSRVADLEPTGRRAIEAVSIAPREMDLDCVRPLAGAGSSHLAAVVDAGGLVTDGHAFRFRHELARAAVESSIPKIRRLDLHAKMTGLLAEEDPLDLARIAHHAIQAESSWLIAEYAPAAAEEAAERFSHREAVSFYEAALANSEGMAKDDLAEMRVKAARQFLIVERVTEGLEMAELAVGHFERAGQVEPLAKALTIKSSGLWRSTDTVASRETQDEAIRLLEGLDEGEDLAEAYVHAAHLRMLARQYADAKTLAEHAAEWADRVDSIEVARSARLEAGYIEIVMGDARRGASILRGAVAESRKRDDLFDVGWVLSNLGSGAGEARLYPEAIEALDESIAIGLEQDNDYLLGYERAWMARVAFEQGRYADAIEWGALVEATSPDSVGIAAVTAKGAVGRALIRRGDEGGRQLLKGSVEMGVLHEVQHV